MILHCFSKDGYDGCGNSQTRRILPIKKGVFYRLKRAYFTD